MAHIPYVPWEEIREKDRVPDTDHILRIHGIHPRMMRRHYDLYVDLMRRKGPLSFRQRETIAVVVSAINGCRY